MFDTVYRFADQCKDYLAPLVVERDGRIVIEEKFCDLTEWARQQICRISGCTPAFYEVLAETGNGRVFNNVIPREKKFLLKTVEPQQDALIVRAVLSRGYSKEVTNVWVIENVVQKVNFTKVLATSSVSFTLKKFDFDYLAVKVRSDDAALLILNSETGKAALSCFLQFKIGKTYLTTAILRKIHKGIDISVAEDALMKGVTAVVTKINTIIPESLKIKFKLRKFDLKLFPYPSEVKKILFDPVKVKEEGIVEVSLEEIVEKAAKIEDFRWNLIVSCDLYNVCTAPASYFKEGWLIKWPVRTNWLA